jgi:hypothetical protein
VSEYVTVTVGADSLVVVEVPTFVAVAAPGPQGAPGGPFTRGASVLAPSGGMAIVVWRCTFPVEVLAVRGHRRGGTGATVNARRIPDVGGPVQDHLATDLSLATEDEWLTGGAIQNPLYAIGDTMEVVIPLAEGLPEQVAVQVDLARL